MVLAHCQVIIVNVSLLSYDSKVEKLVLQAQLRFTAHKIFSAIEILGAEINSAEMRLSRKEIALLYRHDCFTGKCTTRKIHKNYIWGPSGLFYIISHVSLSMT